MPHAGTTRAIHALMEGITAYRGPRNVNRTSIHWRPALLLVSLFLGCGGVVGSGPSQPPPAGVTVSLSPDSASILRGEAQAFAATVSNSTNTAVTWGVN